MKPFYLLYLCGAFVWLACTPTEKKEKADKKSEAEKPKVEAKQDEKSLTKMLDGRWESLEDPRNTIEFTPWNAFREVNGADTLTHAPYTFDATCKGYGKDIEQDKKRVGCLTVKDKEEVFKYIIYTLTAEKLEYSMVGGRGNTLVYKKSQ